MAPPPLTIGTAAANWRDGWCSVEFSVNPWRAGLTCRLSQKPIFLRTRPSGDPTKDQVKMP